MTANSNDPRAAQCLDVARHGATALVSVVGLGNMHLAPTLQAFVEDGIPEGCVRIALDLESCRGLDSTFMGTMVGLSVTLKERDGWLCVMNVGPDNERLLRTLGVWEFISVIHRPRVDPAPLVRLYPTTDTGARLIQIHQAHRHLIELDAGNRERFGKFLEAIEKEMAVNEKASQDEVLTLDGLEELPPENGCAPSSSDSQRTHSRPYCPPPTSSFAPPGK